jgi:dTDP-4-amino-4,6-dideoxygalactose transaminase
MEESSPEYIFTNSARSALRAVIEEEGLEGSKIIIPAFICESAFKPLFKEYSIEPIFVDIDMMRLSMKIEEAEAEAQNADALILVHAFGMVADIEIFEKICRENDLIFIQDCARAFGARYKGERIEFFGDYSIFSLYKISPLVRGGLLVANKPIEVPFPILGLKVVDIAFLMPETFRPYFYTLLRKTGSFFNFSTRTKVRNTLNKPRKLNRLNKWFFKLYSIYLERSIMPSNKIKIEKLNQALGREIVHTFQYKESDMPYIYPALVKDRNDVYSLLDEKKLPVKRLWDKPWAYSHLEDFREDYPNSEYISNNIIQFDLRRLDWNEIDQILGIFKE